MATFQELAAQYLAGFGFQITAEEVEAQDIVVEVSNEIARWQQSVDDRTWSVLQFGGGELADGMWHAGFFERWPKLYELVKSNVSGSWRDTIMNINTCLQHAIQEAADQPAGLAGGTGIDDVLQGG
jgi:hypothetical protein